ncbi:MAG: porin family protein [Sulfurovaceae bacterium]|nr:porin family protein [Sulfurovaceae bacterium]
MKKFTLSVVTVLSMSAFAVAGGDIEPVEPEVVVPAPAPEPVVVDDSGLYLGVAYSSVTTKVNFDWATVTGIPLGDGQAKVSNESAFMGQAGYQFNKYFALEGRYWYGSNLKASYSYDDFNGSPGSGESNIDLNAYGIFAKPMFPVTEQFSIYGLAGYGNTQLKTDNADVKTFLGTDKVLDKNGFQWGGGVSYAITDNLSIFADYVNLAHSVDKSYDLGGVVVINTSFKDVYTINGGLTYRF